MEKYKPGNKGFCLEISPEGRRPKGDISSKSPELPGLYFSHIFLKIMLCISHDYIYRRHIVSLNFVVYVTIVYDVICALVLNNRTFFLLTSVER